MITGAIKLAVVSAHISGTVKTAKTLRVSFTADIDFQALQVPVIELNLIGRGKM